MMLLEMPDWFNRLGMRELTNMKIKEASAEAAVEAMAAAPAGSEWL